MEMLISASEEAFLHVGSMIGFFILLFGYINYKTSGNFTNIISKNRKLQPLMGALIGAIPGCGGSLAIMPLYIKGKLSFGAIIASLIASMGDASFVLISSNIKMYFFVTIVSTITGIITGQLVDYFKLEEKLGLKNRRESDKYNISKNNSKENKEKHNHDEIILDNLAKSHGNTNRLAFIITHGKGYKIYIGIILIGFIFMSLAHSGINLPIIEKLHSLEEVIAVIGILFSIIYMWCFKKVFKNSNQKEEENKKISLREMLIHSVGEISFVITWIFIAYLIYDLIILILGGDEYLVKLVLSTGVISVFIGAGLGLIPGCGIQIVLMSFYLKGTIPLGAVIANSISQDGDALFPLLAMDKKSSLWAMIITTIPAILVGMIVYVLLG
ncbi:arsenic efflux protein [Clostridioides sp. ZZV15-6383]|uniref:putative manganese transporter n=1 Tax=Clostridioides sp. ZZV15-6383 TaxID=2811498 RepID=UPI001DC58873|nr:arsenic efflux protein [Clostridioides sp. ZZV15-6383]